MEFNLDKNKTESEIYNEISNILKHLIIPSDKLISNLSNFVALLKDSFDKISWVGFYIAENDKLFLGPFQGNVACTEIQFGKGVCGTVAQTQSTLIVNDVNSFPNHIACDSKSQSEIVIPIIVDGKTWGVLDIDSYSLSSFTEMDKNYLEQFVANLNSNLELNKFNFI
jgi:GAF domain-containing protein